MKVVLYYVMVGCLFATLASSQCTANGCTQCPDVDVCEGCDSGYYLYDDICMPEFGMKGQTTLTQQATLPTGFSNVPFLKAVDNYILTHEFNQFKLIELANDGTVASELTAAATMIFDADMEIINNELRIVVLDFGMVATIFDSSLSTVGTIATPTDDDIFAKVDLDEEGQIALTFMGEGKLHLYSLAGTFLTEILLENSAAGIESVKLCPNHQVLLTVAESETLTNFLLYSRESAEDPYTKAQTISLVLAQSSQIEASSGCSIVSIMNSDGPTITVLRKNGDNLFEEFEMIHLDDELYKVTINGDGDIIVASTVQKGSSAFKYNQCSEEYEKFIGSPDNYEGVAISGNTIYMGLQDEGIHVWEYTSEIVDPCPCGVGEFDDGGGCSPCIDNCDVCLDGSTCSGCSEGYKLTDDQGCAKIMFGLKNSLTITPTQTLTEAREVEDIVLSEDFTFVNVKYEMFHVYLNSDTSAAKDIDNRFISDMDFHPQSSTLVISSFDQNIIMAQIAGDGTVQSPEFIQTDSQVLEVDFNKHGNLLSGHMNGDLKLFDVANSYGEKLIIPHEGGRIEGAKLCDDGRILALVEAEGFFAFQVFSGEGLPLQDLSLDELVDVHLDATDDCATVSISSTFQMKVEIFRKSAQDYTLFAELQETHPVGKASINPDGDIIIVPLLSSKDTNVYKYNACINEFEAADPLSTEDFPSTSAISATQIAIGTVDGKVELYSQEIGTSQCDPFGKKVSFSYSYLTPIMTSRLITHLHLSGNLLLATEKHSATELFQLSDTELTSLGTFQDDNFTSSGDINANSECFVLSSHNKSATVYSKQGESYQLLKKIDVGSQVTSVDMKADDCGVLLGHKDGSLTLHNPSDYDNPAVSIENVGQEVFDGKVCTDGSILAIFEKAGEFFFRQFTAAGVQNTQILIEDELIQAFMAATEDCSTVVIGGVTMASAKVYKLADDGTYSNDQSETIPDGHPLSAVAINQEGDLILLSRLAIDASSILYKFTLCLNQYVEENTVSSGDFDSANALNNQYLVQGNEAGTIKVTYYHWMFAPTCPVASSAADSIRNKSTVSNSDGVERLEEMKEGSPYSEIVQYIVFGSAILVLVVIFIGTRICKKSKKPEVNLQNLESTKEINISEAEN